MSLDSTDWSQVLAGMKGILQNLLPAPGNHQDLSAQKLDTRIFVCDICKNGYVRKKHLDRHLESHKPRPGGPTCWICIRGGKRGTFARSDTLRRHVLTVHTEEPHPLVSANGGITWNRRKHDLNLAHSKVTPGLEDHDDSIVKLALSSPPEFRRTGGIFDKGPLKGKNFVPGSNAFNIRGTLQAHYPRYHHINEKLRQEKSQTQELAPVPVPESMPLRRSNREGNKSKPVSLPPRVFIRSGPTRPAVACDVFQELPANHFEIELFKDSPRPRNWPKDLKWPNDPTSTPPGEPRCDYCTEVFCTCIVDMMEGTSRLKKKHCGETGWGLVAVALKLDKDWKTAKNGVHLNKQGKIKLFEKGRILEQLKGLLVPNDTKYDDGWSSEICRLDLEKSPISGRIYCLREGNLMVFINHSCEPNCELFGSRMSGSYVQAIKTLRAIYDGEELTISYGPSYFTKKDPCKCDSKICPFRKQDAGEDISKSVSDKAGQKRKAAEDEQGRGTGEKKPRPKRWKPH